MVQRERAALERRLTELRIEEADLNEVIAGYVAQQPHPEVMGKEDNDAGRGDQDSKG